MTLYPRVRGANLSQGWSRDETRPLPPRARGKLSMIMSIVSMLTSTPACAGQTTPGPAASRTEALYPRVRGANRYLRAAGLKRFPLPPRARGKPRTCRALFRCGASTPACAGQTEESSRGRVHDALYPRVRGAND